MEGAEVRLRHGIEAAEDADLRKDGKGKRPTSCSGPAVTRGPPPAPTHDLTDLRHRPNPTLPYPTGTLRRTCASMRHMAASEEAGARAVPPGASGCSCCHRAPWGPQRSVCTSDR
jgi:hypothetical protein